jgi:hypothetical protein
MQREEGNRSAKIRRRERKSALQQRRYELKQQRKREKYKGY